MNLPAASPTKASIEAMWQPEDYDGEMLAWRFLIVLFKSALMVALFELLSPVAEAIGLQLKFVATVASALSHATPMSYREAETLFLFLLATTLLEVTRFVWDLITG